MYGPSDNFDLTTAHVLPALIRRFHEAKQTGQAPTLWGTGKSWRDFLHVDDCASASLLLMERCSAESIVNIGAGRDIPIADPATLVAEGVGYRGPIHWDSTKPDGTPRKLLDVAGISTLQWSPKTSFSPGIRAT